MSGEAVNHPDHYGGAENVYEAIKVIEAWGLGFCLGNAVKYIARAGKKDPARTVEDLRKARWYLDRDIQRLEKEAQGGAMSDRPIGGAELDRLDALHAAVCGPWDDSSTWWRVNGGYVAATLEALPRLTRELRRLTDALDAERRESAGLRDELARLRVERNDLLQRLTAREVLGDPG